MVSRKNFLKTSGLATLGFASGRLTRGLSTSGNASYKSKRPAPADRNFTSQAVEAAIKEVKNNIADPKLAWIFENCYPNTLDTTVEFQMKDGRPDTFVITGDIKAMWLRDSSAQVWPYVPFASKDDHLQQMLAGVINRQTACIHIDPYANAFNKGSTGSEFDSDLTAMKPQLHERKWEVDSLCYPIRLAHGYWKQTGDTAPFDDRWQQAMQLILQTFHQQQRKNGRGPYHFQRKTANPTDSVPLGGYGRPVKPVGLICSIFRPSDDATIYPFLIPSNFFAIHSLRQMAQMLRHIRDEGQMATQAENLADEVEEALKKYAIQGHKDFGKVYAYEIDGMGNHTFMDDANVPSLLSLPYLQTTTQDDPVYQNTRKLILSENNPYFFHGKAAEGIGGIHVGLNMIWPMSIIMRGLTTDDDHEISHCLNMLKNTQGGTGFMHESFNKNNPEDFTRSWFAWANTLFGEFVHKIYQQKPGLIT